MYKNALRHDPGHITLIRRNKHKWDSGELEFIRTIIRTYLNIEFKNQCFYCGSSLNQGNSKAHIEHIVHKDKYKRFTYFPENLTLSCQDCNTSKGQQDTLIETLRDKPYRYNDYSLNNQDYVIIHPYLDNYGDHIKVEDFMFLPINNSEKGKETIKMCSLYRIKMAEDKARTLLNKAEDYRIFSKHLGNLKEHEIEQKILDYLEQPPDFESYCTLIIECCENESLVRISRLLVPFDLTCLTIDNVEKVNRTLPLKVTLEQYNDLIKYIEGNIKLKDALTNYLDKNEIGDFNPKKRFQFSEQSMAFIYDAVIKSKINIHPKTKTKFLTLLGKCKDDDNLISVIECTQNARILVNTCDSIHKILSNKTILNLIKAVTPTIIELNQKQFNKIGNRLSENIQFNAMRKIDIVYIIKDWNKEDIKDLKKALIGFC